MQNGYLVKDIMRIEKSNQNTKWFKKDGLRIKIKNKGDISEIWITLDKYNICFKLLMFDFIQQLKEEMMLDITADRVLGNQRIFVINSNYDMEIVNYIEIFINEWNIRISKNTDSDADIIPDEIWYE